VDVVVLGAHQCS